MTQRVVVPAGGRPTPRAAHLRMPAGLTLRMDRPGPCAVRVYPVTGRCMFSATGKGLSLSLRPELRGMALVEIQSGGRSQVVRATAAS